MHLLHKSVSPATIESGARMASLYLGASARMAKAPLLQQRGPRGSPDKDHLINSTTFLPGLAGHSIPCCHQLLPWTQWQQEMHLHCSAESRCSYRP